VEKGYGVIRIRRQAVRYLLELAAELRHTLAQRDAGAGRVALARVALSRVEERADVRAAGRGGVASLLRLADVREAAPALCARRRRDRASRFVLFVCYAGRPLRGVRRRSLGGRVKHDTTRQLKNEQNRNEQKRTETNRNEQNNSASCGVG